MKPRIPLFPFAHTFSIVGFDERCGQMGVAVQSHVFSVGPVVVWAEPGIGVVATQAVVEVGYGPRGLALMESGMSAGQALQALLAADERESMRQVAMIDARGGVSAHTGGQCIAAAGHETGANFSVQANMMASEEVWPAMAEAYRAACRNPELDLAGRLLAALDAAQTAGGDIRGQQSAAIKVVEGKVSGALWEGVVMDLRVEDHPAPLEELRRLAGLQRAYALANQGDISLSKGEIEQALQAFSRAAAMVPQNPELPFWHGVALLNMGRLEEARPIFEKVFRAEPIWAELLERLPAAGLLEASPEVVRQVQGWR